LQLYCLWREKVFFSELQYTHIEAEPAYTLLALTCDVGGALGLILGSTLLTFCEVADLVLALVCARIKVRTAKDIKE